MELILMTQQDYSILYDLYTNQEVMKMITGYPLSDHDIKERWSLILTWSYPYGYYKALVNNECVGFGCLKPHENDVEVGYALFPQYFSQGYGSLIGQKLVELASTMNIQRMVAYIDPLNIASKRILEKQGFKSVYIKKDTEFLERRVK